MRQRSARSPRFSGNAVEARPCLAVARERLFWRVATTHSGRRACSPEPSPRSSSPGAPALRRLRHSRRNSRAAMNRRAGQAPRRCKARVRPHRREWDKGLAKPHRRRATAKREGAPARAWRRRREARGRASATRPAWRHTRLASDSGQWCKHQHRRRCRASPAGRRNSGTGQWARRRLCASANRTALGLALGSSSGIGPRAVHAHR